MYIYFSRPMRYDITTTAVTVHAKYFHSKLIGI